MSFSVLGLLFSKVSAANAPSEASTSSLSAGVSSSCLCCGSELTPTLQQAYGHRQHRNGVSEVKFAATTFLTRVLPAHVLRLQNTIRPVGKATVLSPPLWRCADSPWCLAKAFAWLSLKHEDPNNYTLNPSHCRAKPLTSVPACRPVLCSWPVLAARRTPATHGRAQWADPPHPPA